MYNLTLVWNHVHGTKHLDWWVNMPASYVREQPINIIYCKPLHSNDLTGECSQVLYIQLTKSVLSNLA